MQPRAGGAKSYIHAVVLAAGESRRFGAENKLLAPVGGVPLVRHVVESLLASCVNGVTIVTGHDEDAVRGALAGLDLEFTYNPRFARGLSSSLRCGVERMSGDVQCAMIVLADMPGLTTGLTNTLIETFEREGGNKIVFPVRPGGAQGNPVLWPRRYFHDLLKLEGDRGAKAIIAANPGDCAGVPVEDESIFRDIDAPADLAEWPTGSQV